MLLQDLLQHDSELMEAFRPKLNRCKQIICVAAV